MTKITVSARLDRSEVDAIEAIAKAEGRSFSAVIARLVRAGLVVGSSAHPYQPDGPQVTDLK